MPDNSEKRIRSVSAQNLYGGEAKMFHRTKRLNPSYQSNSNLSLQELRKLLLRDMVYTYDLKTFIPVHSIKKFWATEHNLQDVLVGLDCSDSSAHVILTTSLRIFTALVLVDWESDGRFREVFRQIIPDYAEPFRADESLTDADTLWTDGSLTAASSPVLDYIRELGLSMDEEISLKSAMHLVSVPILEMGKESKPFHEHTTLPITQKSELGKGAYGKVYEIRIAKGHFMVENTSGNASPNEAEDRFALKTMNDAYESQRELEFLRKYRENSRKSKHIMIHLAIIERGNEANVIYPLAQGDLQKLLEGKLESLQWDGGDAGQFRDIVRKSCDLADGLDFLHSDMRNYSNLVCRHGDLKPNNFLVCENEWKISDMGLARVRNTSTDESGVRKTTKTISKDGCGPYAAPEMSGPEGTLIGRETDVWSLAAIIMELIIWGFGGPSAWADFVRRREDCSRGLFHKDKALSRAVDDELRSWPTVHSTKMSKFLHQGENQASEFLKDMTGALRGAFEIDPDKRARSKDFLNSMENVYKHFEGPKKMKRGTAKTNKLEIRTRPSITAWESLQRKFDEHRSNEIFSRDHFTPNEQIRISNETEDCIRKWMLQPTPSALCISTRPEKERLHVSAIIHEVYYTARYMDYEVIEFLTLNRYDRTSTTLQAGLDFVYCFIFQLLKISKKPEDQLKNYDLDRLDIEDANVSNKVKFDSAINVLKQVIQTQQNDQKSKPIILIVDEFWQVCTRTTLDTMREQWKTLFALLGCGKENAGPSPVTPNFRILIRANGWYNELVSDLGFSGKKCTPSGTHNLRTLRSTLKELFQNVA